MAVYWCPGKGKRDAGLVFFTTRLVAFICLAAELSAQQPVVRSYSLNTADEDWSFLRDRTKRNDFWDPLKYISLGREGRYLTLSSEIRYRVEGFHLRGDSSTPSTMDNYLLQRYLVGADLHLGPRLRLFTEFQSGIINGQLRSPRPQDRNIADFHQAFLEWRQPVKGKSVFGLKAGRQEMSIGSSRLISASPGLNVKRSFDGALLYFRSDSWRVSGTFAKLVAVNPSAFDDRPDHEQTFWGVSASRKSPRFQKGELGFYYLDVDRARAEYDQGQGRDLRRTVGVKWTGTGTRLDLNYDFIWQWGSFEGSAVRAWAFSTETGYRFAGTRGKPRLSVRTDIASGDRDRSDPKLQSFNPLFPGNSYSGQVGFFGPTNLTDFTPAVTFILKKNAFVSFEAPSYWRTSTADGVYTTDLKLLWHAAVGQGKYVGTNPGVVGVWQATRHITFQGAISRFFAGAFLEKTIAAGGFGFYSATLLYRF
jgi:Alginate export